MNVTVDALWVSPLFSQAVCKCDDDLHLCPCAAQLEFVQILVIVVVMMVMVVVITCLLNHYRLSARSLLSRHAPTRRRHLPLANVSAAHSPSSSTVIQIESKYN